MWGIQPVTSGYWAGRRTQDDAVSKEAQQVSAVNQPPRSLPVFVQTPYATQIAPRALRLLARPGGRSLDRPPWSVFSSGAGTEIRARDPMSKSGGAHWKGPRWSRVGSLSIPLQLPGRSAGFHTAGRRDPVSRQDRTSAEVARGTADTTSICQRTPSSSPLPPTIVPVPCS